MALRFSDNDLNPGQSDYEDTINNPAKKINDAESKGTVDKNSKSATDDINSAESNPMNYTGTGVGTSQSKYSGAMSFVKKKGPITGIILTLVGGGLGIGGLLSPSLLVVNLKETLTDKFNTQLTSMDIRTNKILSKKTTSGICGVIFTVKCRYSTMSKRQVANFKKAGIDVIPDDSGSLFGRTKPSSFEFEGKPIKAADFTSEIANNSNFRAATKKAYNPKFYGFVDDVWTKASNFLKISKKPPVLDGDDFDSKMEELAEDLQDKNKLDKQPIPDGDDIDPNTGEEFSDSADDALDAAQEQAEAINDIIEDSGGDGSVASKMMNGAEGVGNAVKVTGFVDDVCSIYRTFRSLGYAAKLVRTLQLASYAILFLNVADQIKSGDANPDDVSFYGDILTRTTIDDNGREVSATDSLGYQYAAYNNVIDTQTDAMKYMAAAGLTGAFVNFFASHPKALSGTCNFLGNPIVGLASLAGGVALTVVSLGGWGGIKAAAVSAKAAGMAGAKAAAMQAMRSPGFWGGIGIAFAELFLPGLLKDIVAGKVIDKDTVGADAGNAITSGASGIMGTTAKFGGNSPLTPEQAVAYSKLSNEVLANYAEEERLSHSPFDVSNRNTFLGNIALKLTPVLSSTYSLVGVISSMTSLTQSTFSSIVSPLAKAETVENYSTCQDITYKELGLATDPFCNVIYGIPAESIDVDPDIVADALISSGDIYETDNSSIGAKAGDIVPDSKYSDFIKSCIERPTPLGEGEDTGADCLFNENNKNYYLYYIDKRVQDGMDEDPDASSASLEAGGSLVGDSEQPANTVAKGEGWTLKDGVDYSGVPCASGSEEDKIYTHPTKNFIIRLCKTKLGLVSSLISQRVVNMVNAASADGVNLVGSSWRSYEEQQRLRAENCSRGHCSPPTASPGNSQHERGIGTDFGAASTGGTVWNWLVANGAKYGYHNLPSEYWHWSMSGG